MPSSYTFAENDGISVVEADFLQTVAPGPLTALDELQRQSVRFTFTPINVPVGLMRALPTITVNGTAGNWPGRNTYRRTGCGLRYAVYRVTAIDNDSANPRTSVQTLTINVTPVNDVQLPMLAILRWLKRFERDGKLQS